jgi:hypothetical protein
MQPCLEFSGALVREDRDRFPILVIGVVCDGWMIDEGRERPNPEAPEAGFLCRSRQRTPIVFLKPPHFARGPSSGLFKSVLRTQLERQIQGGDVRRGRQVKHAVRFFILTVNDRTKSKSDSLPIIASDSQLERERRA